MDMPTKPIIVNGKQKRTLDLSKLGAFFELHAERIRLVTIEDPHAAPGQGVTSMFNFGFNCGAAQMAVAAHAVPTYLVRPAKWKLDMGLTSNKDDSRALATKLLPQFAHHWSLKKHDGRAEATLLAIYGAQRHG